MLALKMSLVLGIYHLMSDVITTISAALGGGYALKVIDNYASLLLKPSIEAVGKEMQTSVKQIFKNIKNKRKAENLQGHLKKVAAREAQPKPCDPKRAPDIDLIQAWIEGAERIDPEDDVLGAIWQAVLLDILAGSYADVSLLQLLKKLDRSEAVYLFKVNSSVDVPPMRVGEGGAVNALSMRKLLDMGVVVRSDVRAYLLVYIVVFLVMGVSCLWIVVSKVTLTINLSAIVLTLLLVFASFAFVYVNALKAVPFLVRYRITLLGRQLVESCPATLRG